MALGLWNAYSEGAGALLSLELDHDIACHFAKRIRELQAEHEYSREEFANNCDVYGTWMGTIERGGSNLI